MQLEQAIELERLAVPHEFATSKYDEEVQEGDGGRLPRCGHGSLALDKLELIRMVAHDRGPRRVQDRPQRHWRRDLANR